MKGSFIRFIGAQVITFFLVALLQSGHLIFSAGCGSSSEDDSGGGAGASGGTGSALTVAEKVSVVDASSSGSASLSAAVKQAVSDLPAGSDYNTDETFVFVEERSAEVFDVVNEILCMMDQSRYEEMVNLGDYLAYVDVTQCEKEGDSVEGVGESSSDGSSGGERPEYDEWVVNSYRRDDSSPHIVAVWIHMGGDEFDPPMLIHGRAEITEAKSEANPYGIFKMDFQAFFDDGDMTDTSGEPMMTGYLMTERDADGIVLLKFFDNADFGDGGGFHERVTLSREGSSVLGHMSASENFSGESHEKDFQVAADDAYFYRTDGSNNVCLSRTDFEETVWGYNLYTTEDDAAPGSLVTRNSGFSITFDADDGETYHGWMGYWGIWLPEEASLESGDTVYQETWDEDEETTGTPYTAVIVPGKLKKHTRNTVTLEEIHGIPLYWSRCDDAVGECNQYVVEWNKDTQKLMKTAEMNVENWIPEEITPEEVAFTEDDWDFSFWSESLQGDGMVALRNEETGDLTALTNNSVVVFYKEDIIIPGSADVPTNLACFWECPDPADPSSYIAASLWEAGDASYERLSEAVATGSLVAGTHYAAYTYDATTGLLMSGNTPIVTEEEGEFGSGIWTGQMIDPANLADLACDWDTSTTCAWKIWNTPEVTYSWETGPNEWNQFSALQDQSTGEFLDFEPPLFLEYTHSDGVKYYLQYSGPGDLWGFPEMCVNMDTGTEVDCGNWDEDSPIRWVTAISAPDGSVVTDTTTELSYYTKAMDKEQRMIAVAESLCTSAGLAFPDYDLPDESLWEEPVIGDEPDVDAPAVVGGVLQ